ncbi:MAG: O-antigen ligase family protein [Prevotella sp.]|nr:O-antigen ligase family protein [Prevotella sp.]
MKNIHVPTLIILGGSIFCFSTQYFELANTIQRCWTGGFAILLLIYYFAMVCLGKCVTLPKDQIMKTLCILGILEIIFSIIQLFGLLPDNYKYAHFSGSLNNPAIFGMLLSFCVPVSVYFLKYTDGKEKTLWKFLFVIFAVFIILSDSRTAILASACGALLVLLMMEKNLFREKLKKRKFKFLTYIFIVLTFVFLYFYKRDSAEGRFLIWNVCVEMIKEKPLWGWGTDGFYAHYMNYQAEYLKSHAGSPFALLADETQNPFNEFLHIAIVCGVPCCLFFIGIIIGTIWYLCNRRIEHCEVLLGLTLVFVVWCMFCYPLTTPFVWMILSFIALSMISLETLPKPCHAVIFVMCLFCLFLMVKNGYANIRRVSLQEYAMNNHDIQVMDKYESMYREMSSNGLFLYNYAAMLHLNGDYEKSITVFKECSAYINDYNMMLLMGDNYQQMDIPDSAIVYYKRASEMIPNRFLPLYYQMAVYQEQGNNNKAKEIAEIIVHKENKIKKSKTVNEIIKRANECLRE